MIFGNPCIDCDAPDLGIRSAALHRGSTATDIPVLLRSVQTMPTPASAWNSVLRRARRKLKESHQKFIVFLMVPRAAQLLFSLCWVLLAMDPNSRLVHFSPGVLHVRGGRPAVEPVVGAADGRGAAEGARGRRQTGEPAGDPRGHDSLQGHTRAVAGLPPEHARQVAGLRPLLQQLVRPQPGYNNSGIEYFKERRGPL